VASVLKFETVRRMGELSTVYVGLIGEASQALLVPIVMSIRPIGRGSLTMARPRATLVCEFSEAS
jgi:hypothetical protein